MPDLDWTGPIGGALAMAFAAGVSFISGIFYKVVYVPMSKTIITLRDDYKELYERLLEVVSKHD